MEQVAQSRSGLTEAASPAITMIGLRRAAGNVGLALMFFITAAPSAQRYGSWLANTIWIGGALLMGALSLIRVPAKETTIDFQSLTSSAGMVLLPALMRPGEPSFPALANIAVIVELAGVLFSQAARIYMGRSFGILPANRGIVSAGPFRIVRHPVYLGWFILSLGYAMSYASWRNCALVAVALPFTIWRIELEERLLTGDAEYRAYRSQVRFRLLPGIY
jgi:protein-S-isoprenylcysteine O-methyltransferase Ste14